MMTQGQGTWVPVQEDKGDNFSCAKTPHDPACQNPQQTQPQSEVSAPTCARYASLQGGRSSSTFTCMCNNGGNYPNCKAPDGEESPDSRYEACKAQALQAISSCEGSYSSASSSCATTRVDGVVQQAQAENEQRLRQSENTAQTCGGTAQAYQNAANQLGSVQTSCQSSVSQCASNCAQAQSAVQQCPHSAVRARAQSVPTAQTSCTSGDLSRRPLRLCRPRALCEMSGPEKPRIAIKARRRP
ncbi:MAG: hypothetical protein KF789_08790 [Bdellovibrionaceae bacterium]|nr:hypothetical protein [Pseudobdellovibrionaceae bacterium]